VRSRLNSARGNVPQGLKPPRVGRHSARLPFAAQGKKPCPDVTHVVRFWPRVEMGRSFVLNKLRRILLVGQNRVEMRENSGECLLDLGQNRSGRVGSLRRRGRVARSEFGRRSFCHQHQRRAACRFLSGPKYIALKYVIIVVNISQEEKSWKFTFRSLVNKAILLRDEFADTKNEPCQTAHGLGYGSRTACPCLVYSGDSLSRSRIGGAPRSTGLRGQDARSQLGLAPDSTPRVRRSSTPEFSRTLSSQCPSSKDRTGRFARRSARLIAQQDENQSQFPVVLR